MSQPPRRPKRAAPSAPAPAKRAASTPLVIAIGWSVLLLLYAAVFYTTPIAAGAMQFPRAEFLLLAFTPEFYWEAWTGDGMRFAVLDRLPIAGMTIAILLVAYALGLVLLTLLRVSRALSSLETFVFAEGVGLNVLSLIVLAAGLAGWLRSPVVWIGLGGIAAVLFIFVAMKRRREVAVRSAPADRSSWWLLAGLPVAVFVLLGAMRPPWEFDVREYHLQVPKEWYRQGEIDFLPHNVYGNMPLGAEALAIPAMTVFAGERDWWWCALVGKTVMACYAPLTALGLFAAGRRFFSPWAGVAAALVYISIPWVGHTAMAGLNDHVLACYVFLAFYAILLWKEEPTSRGLLALSAFLAGAAAACKYTGLLFAVAPLGLLATITAIRQPPLHPHPDPTLAVSRARAPLLAALIFTLAAAAGGGLWYAKNWALAGNPVYPLMVDVFGGRTRTPEKDAQWRRAHQVPRSEEAGPYAPSRLAAAAARIGWRSEWLSPLLVPLLVLAPLSRNRQALLWAAGMMLYLLAVWWLFTHRIDRFWIPALPAAALLAGAGAAWSDDRRWRILAFSVVIVGLAANMLVIASPVIGDARVLVSLAALRTDVRDPEANPGGRLSPAHHYLNEHVPPGRAVLLVGDAQPFDLEPRTFYNTAFDSSVFEELMKDRTTSQRREALAARNITHVLVDWREIARYRSPGNYGYTDYVQPGVFEELVAQGVLKPAWPAGASDGERFDSALILVYEVMK